eukprot:COSAG04_NODE_26553_length_293_cov_1.061856_1_plen_84_part_10
MMGCRRWRILTPADQQESFASRLWELLVRSSKCAQHLCLQDTSSQLLFDTAFETRINLSIRATIQLALEPRVVADGQHILRWPP